MSRPLVRRYRLWFGRVTGLGDTNLAAFVAGAALGVALFQAAVLIWWAL